MNDVNSLSHTSWNCKLPYRVCTEISKESVFRAKEKGDRRDIKNTVQLEKGEDHRSRSVSRSYPHVGGDPTEVFCIKLYGIPEGKEQFDAVRKISGAKI